MDRSRKASLRKRFGALLYEAVLLFGVCFFISALVHTLLPFADEKPWVLQLVLFVALGAYFSYCWHKTGQTLAMKTWRLKVVSTQSTRISWRVALLRYCAAWFFLLPAMALIQIVEIPRMTALAIYGASFLLIWACALFNSQRTTLHDWVARTRIENMD